MKISFKWLTYILLFISLIIICVWFGEGFNKKVYQNEYAVVQNKYTTNIKGPMDQGTYNNLSIGDTMFKYTSTMQFMDFDGINLKYIECITNDGLHLNLELIIQYQYQRNQIIPIIWYQFNNAKSYTDFLIKTIYGIIYEDCAFFQANDYYSKRNLIENRMYDTIFEQFNIPDSGIMVFNVQLKDIIFPQAFIDVISSKQHLVQEIQTQYNNRTSQLINANTTLIQAQQQAQINVINAQNEANLVLLNANTTASNIEYKYEQMAEYMYNIKTKFRFNSSELIDYIYAQYVKSGAVYAGI
jgi:regulator of protease activity HflC (stomatin/prohibitin superfamily)